MENALTNVILYFATAGAQVWATLMVFHVVLVRDCRREAEAETRELWATARLWWGKLIEKLLCPGAQGWRDRLGEWGLDELTVSRADTDPLAFRKTLFAIRSHRIIEKEKFEEVVNDQDLTAEAWQRKLDPVADRLAALEDCAPNPRSAFYVGIAGIAFDLVVLVCHGYIAHSRPSLDVEIAALVGVNLALGVLFVSQTVEALG